MPRNTVYDDQFQRDPIFVIQQHDAPQMHYDLRLEIGGVLKTWEVPKGPSTDPRQVRSATAAGDHPVTYAEFEGVIPIGKNGMSTVLVWDTGTYENLREDAAMEEALQEGRIEMWLQGNKLRGGYRLRRSKATAWQLKKMGDREADARRNPVSTQPLSILTGRTIKEVREEEA